MSGDSVVYDGLDEAGTARTGQAPRAVSAAIEGLCTVHGCARRSAAERAGERAAAGHRRP